ncbi:hypothetical protein Syun_014509 [Stephania yunnanensis]|uniref:Tim44-like domain-containing protein n=1 Tax=Stephania yunnanensis TaxID=152371 RepID=A0AAP0JJR0_9MAGN
MDDLKSEWILVFFDREENIIGTIADQKRSAVVQNLKSPMRTKVVTFYPAQILHISELEIKETKPMGSTPIIIVVFQTQQIHCIRERQGSITEGGKDTIHTVYYAWAMQQMDVEELGEGALYPLWRLREMQQLGIQALI